MIGNYTINYPDLLQDQCSICLVSLEENKQNVIKTSCPKPHFYHLNCISQWFENKAITDRTCCYCRSIAIPLMKPSGELIYDKIMMEDINQFEEIVKKHPKMIHQLFTISLLGVEIQASLLYIAIALGYKIEKINFLLDQGIDVNTIQSNGQSALMLSAKFNNTKVCKLLLSKGADCNIKINHKSTNECNGFTALMFSVKKNQEETTKLLLQWGCDINASQINAGTRTGRTALMWAIYNGNINITKELINMGANLSIPESNIDIFYGTSPIIWAFIRSYGDIAKAIIAKFNLTRDNMIMMTPILKEKIFSSLFNICVERQ